jgi:hypothetical protein
MANKTSALENACTSALGRSLRWALGGSKGPSKQEMEKVARGQSPKLPVRAWLYEAGELTNAKDIDKLRLLYSEAKTAKADDAILEAIKTMAEGLA